MSAPFEPKREDVEDLLAEVYRPEGVDIWLSSPNRLLDGRRPCDLLDEGDYDVVYGLALAMAEGVAT